MRNTIRLLRPESDHIEWLRLRIALWPEASLESQYCEMAEIARTFDQQPVFVAEVEGSQPTQLCGLMEVAIHTAAPGCITNRIGYLEAWYIDPDFRQQGIGRGLVEAAETWARTQGCNEMASDTDRSYPISPTAHDHLGYRIVERHSNGEIFFAKTLNDAVTQ